VTEDKAVIILKNYGLATIKNRLTKNEDEAESAAKEMGERVVLKIISKDILHKSEVGGVIVGVKIDQIKNEYREMIDRVKKYKPEAIIEGILIEEMINTKRGVELILGATKDPILGTSIMIGLGGIWVEIIKKVSFGLVPVSKNQAKKMIDELKINKIFEGFRNGPALDYEAIVETIGQLSKLLEDNPKILELDINPLLVLPKGEGVKVLDARMVME
jgi:acyl-CoA synthetase (NDP forming)